MPERNAHAGDSTSHPDGRYEGPINDPFPGGGVEMGVKIDADPTLPKQQANPFHATPKVDAKMKEFRKMMQGEEK